MDSGSYVYPIEINATPQKTWDALTQPDLIAEYCDGSQLETDWSIGSPIHMTDVSGDTLFEGTVLLVDEPRVLSYTYSASPARGKPVEPSKVTITLQPTASGTRLTLTQNEFVPYTKLRGAVEKVWPPILSSLKSFLEQ